MLRLSAFAMVAMLTAPLAAADKGTFVDKVFKNEDGHESPYVVFVPANHDKDKPSPVLLFLHGAGETKGGSMMPIQQGIAPHIKRMEEKKQLFKFITIIPQAETRDWRADSPNAKRALAMLDEVVKEYNGDPKRLYLTGLSMGGFGTWSIAAAMPDKFAAIAPICGGGKAEWGEKLKDLPIWCFHGAEDKVVPAKLSQDMIEAIKKAGGKPRYSEFPYVGHNSWDAAYAHDELYGWLLSHAKK
ncbi:MAG: dienelactone hydrolase family protein [Gemmataceae bacterium]|nr:dienelactone hydrolase family protein [Gemmataceae bacterium]